MLKIEQILKDTNKKIIENKILDTRINSEQLEALATVLVEHVNYQIDRICEQNGLIYPE